MYLLSENLSNSSPPMLPPCQWGMRWTGQHIWSTGITSALGPCCWDDGTTQNICVAWSMLWRGKNQCTYINGYLVFPRSGPMLNMTLIWPICSPIFTESNSPSGCANISKSPKISQSITVVHRLCNVPTVVHSITQHPRSPRESQFYRKLFSQ